MSARPSCRAGACQTCKEYTLLHTILQLSHVFAPIWTLLSKLTRPLDPRFLSEKRQKTVQFRNFLSCLESKSININSKNEG